MVDLTISELFATAAGRLRADFEFARCNPHSAEKGTEVEGILTVFLNNHLPKRFKAARGIIIDNQNNMSKQCDVIIYDVLTSPVYRYSDTTLIIPIDTVAAVIEVKTSLSKSELKDSYEKIASCKRLKKRKLSDADRKPTGSELTSVATLGVVFGFDSETSINTLADNVREFNDEYDSKLWPDMVVVLDKGVIDYSLTFPGEEESPGSFGNAHGDEKIVPPPFYLHITSHEDKDFSLNRFFYRILAHLTFFPYRMSTPDSDMMLKDTARKVMLVAGYQYNLAGQLIPTTEDQFLGAEKTTLLSMEIVVEEGVDKGKQTGMLQFIPWQDGAVVRHFGRPFFDELLQILVPEMSGRIIHQPNSTAQLSFVLNITEDDFRGWPKLLSLKTNLMGSIVEPEEIKKDC